jgi:HSP20 family protein
MAVNLCEKDDNYYLQAYLPGVKAEDVDISVDGNTINLKARIPSSMESEDAKNYRWYITELGYGDVNRSVNFPVPVNANRIEASQENGVLTIVVPKAEEAKPKQIKVKPA